jgi:hypothetical protein
MASPMAATIIPASGRPDESGANTPPDRPDAMAGMKSSTKSPWPNQKKP